MVNLPVSKHPNLKLLKLFTDHSFVWYLCEELSNLAVKEVKVYDS